MLEPSLNLVTAGAGPEQVAELLSQLVAVETVITSNSSERNARQRKRAQALGDGARASRRMR